MYEYLTPNQIANQQFYIQVLTKLQELKKETRCVELWLDFAPRQCNGTHSDFSLPIFSQKTNTAT
jgi:hypothetical protein